MGVFWESLGNRGWKGFCYFFVFRELVAALSGDSQNGTSNGTSAGKKGK